MRTAGAVLDTNVLLDLWLFDDPRVHGLREAICSRRLRALRSADCDAEFADVLGRTGFGLDDSGRSRILARWSASSDAIESVRPAPLVCADADDQKFLDAAFSAGARWLLTRDKALLALARRAETTGLRIVSPVAQLTYDR
jgi:predicted nucleic acid-binding protein